MATLKNSHRGTGVCKVFVGVDENGKKYSQIVYRFITKEAEYLAAEYALNKKEIAAKGLTFDEAVTAYIENKESVLSPSTVAEYRRSQGTDIPVAFKRLYIVDITQTNVQAVISGYSKNHSPKKRV